MKFVHVATRTKDLEGAIKFYEQLGLHASRRKELTKGKATLVFMEPEEGNFAIELVYNWGKDDAYPGGERFGHFAFETDDIDAVLPARRAVRRPRHAPAVPARGRRAAAGVHRGPGRQRDRADPAVGGPGEGWRGLNGG